MQLPTGVFWLLATAFLLGLAHPPFNLLIPSFVALVPFGIWVGELPSGSSGRREAVRGGFFLGLVYFTLVFHWLFIALVYYTWLALLTFVAPVVILSGFLSLATLGIHSVHKQRNWPVWLALPVFWTAMEWLRGHLGEVQFPWMGLGDTLTGFPVLIGAADLVGSRGLTFWLALVNGLIAAAFLAGRRSRGGESGKRRGVWRRRGVWSLAVAAAVAAALPITYSVARWRSLETRPVARVTLIQPNIPEDLRLQATVAADSARSAVAWLLDHELRDRGSGTDLVILPETVFSTYVEPIPSVGYEGDHRLMEWMAGLAAQLEAPILFGALGSEDLGERQYDIYNSAFLMDRSGRLEDRYDKRFLVPIVERVPFVNPKWFEGVPFFGGFGVGRVHEPLELDHTSFGVLICYESIFTQLSRRFRRDGAEFLVNITNDAWFGRAEPWWARSSALSQHPAHLVMRAIENRVGVARAANTGVSGVVDPRGRWRVRTELFVTDAVVDQVETTDGLTIYARFGDVIGWSAALTALLGIVLAGIKRFDV